MKSVFENKKVYIKFLYPDKTLPKQHPYYGGKTDKGGTSLSAPHFENKPVKIFNPEELTELEKVADEDLSFSKSNEFWRSGITHFSIPKTGLTLDLTNWVDVVRYRIASHETYKNLIGKGSNYAPTCKYAIFTDKDKSDVAKLSDKRFDNVKFYGKHEEDINVLRYVYFKCAKGGRIALTESLTKVQSRIKEIIELEPMKFNMTSKEKFLEEKGLLLACNLAGLVDKTKIGYMLDSKKLFKGNQGTFEQAAEFIADPIHQDVKFELQGKLEDRK